MDDRIEEMRIQMERMSSEMAELRSRRNLPRFWQAVGAAAAAILLTGVTIASASSSIPRESVHRISEPFEVDDPGGHPVLAVYGDSVLYYGQSHKSELEIQSRLGAAHLTVRHDNGQPIFQAGSGLSGVTGIGVEASPGNYALLGDFGANEGDAVMRFYEGDKKVIGMGPENNGSGGLNLYRSSGELSVGLGSDNSTDPYVELYRKSGTAGLGLGIDSTDNGFAEIEGPQDRATARLGQCTHGGCMQLADNSGSLRVDAGTQSKDVGLVRAIGTKGVDFIIGR